MPANLLEELSRARMTDASEITRVGETPSSLRRSIIDHLRYTCAKDVGQATVFDVGAALAHAVRDRLVHRWLATQAAYRNKEVKLVYYLSSEFLIGRSLGLCLLNLGLYESAGEVMAELGYELGEVLEQEEDPGLGNGGLGRLAACFMDSLATLDLPAVGYGIRYDYGIFEQKLIDGHQVERRDDWLRYGNEWEIPQHEHSQIVRFYGRVEQRMDESGRLRSHWIETKDVLGLPYDTCVVGHNTDTVNTLRLWSARATRDFNLALFNEGDYRRAVEEKVDTENISKVLYPNDKTYEGKVLRLKQQYFFVACSLADIMRRFRKAHPGEGFAEFPNRAAIQLNDTHPSIAVAELMRIFLDVEGFEWDYAWDLTFRTMGYTNHTLLPEALERWPVRMFEELLPRHLQIIYEINRRFVREVAIRWPGDEARISRMSLIEEGPDKQIRMAHLATVGSHSINGVAALHTELVKDQLLNDFYQLYPERFNNKTNGVTPRRWVAWANPSLSELITDKIGDGWLREDFRQIRKLEQFASDKKFLKDIAASKLVNKERLAETVRKLTGVNLNTKSMFVVQVKRIHEYKRQLLQAMQILRLYLDLRRGAAHNTVPRTYIFAGKAAAGYAMAKLHIKFINDLAAMINSDSQVNSLLKVVFVPNYGVSLAEQIMPAADLSSQISLAGKEASGTGNMKFSMNGALTVGTLDGANVEIREEVGPENFFLFGMTAEEVFALRAKGYRPEDFIERSPRLREVIEFIECGILSHGDKDRFRWITEHLRHEDTYMCCADFDAFCDAENQAAELFAQPEKWFEKSVLNIAGTGKFSSDVTINQYAEEIWNIKPVKVKL